MAKVSPLLGEWKPDWKVKLETLIHEIGFKVTDLGESGTTTATFAVSRGGMRLVLRARTWGRNRNFESHLTLYGRKVALILATKNCDLVLAKNTLTGVEGLQDYRALYKTVERRVYAMFNPDLASDIMSAADGLYSTRMEKKK